MFCEKCGKKMSWKEKLKHDSGMQFDGMIRGLFVGILIPIIFWIIVNIYVRGVKK